MAQFADLKVGFIGFGNMAQAVADGLLRADAVRAQNMVACAKHAEKLAASCAARDMRAAGDARAVAREADVVFVAVKPYLVQEVCAPVAAELADKVVVSVAAGVTFERYEEFLAPGTAHLSCIPNTPVRVGEGVWTCEARHSLDAEQAGLVEKLLGTTGLVRFVDTQLMGIAGTVTGCGPAFVAMFMEALGDAAVKYGVPRTLAYELAAQTIAGTGKMAAETSEHPGALKDAVCSPGGTTIRGVAALEEHGLRNAAIKAIDAIVG